MKKRGLKYQPKIPWKLIFSWKRLLVVFTILAVLLIILYNYGYIKKTCKTEECFSDSLQRCAPAKYFALQNYNIYRYAIMGKRGDDCRIDVQLVKMAEGTPLVRIQKLEGKSMVCIVPQEKLEDAETVYIEGLLNYCSGPLKESIYAEIIEKLYSLLVSNLGQTVQGIEENIKKGAF